MKKSFFSFGVATTQGDTSLAQKTKRVNFLHVCKKALFLAFSLCIVLGFVACSDDDDDDDDDDRYIPPPPTGSTAQTPDSPQMPTTDATSFYYPAKDATSAYCDTVLMVKFDAPPTVNRQSDKAVKIFLATGDTLVDTIKAKDETLVTGNNNGAIGDIKVKDQLITVEGNYLVVRLHNAATTAQTLLTPATKYYVNIEAGLVSGKVNNTDFVGITDKTSWSFTTKPAITKTKTTPLSVGKDGTKDFYTIQGALNYVRANGEGGDTWTIDVQAGTYIERLFYNGSANLTITGAQGLQGDFGKTTKVYWKNAENFGGGSTNTGARARSTVFFNGSCSVTLKNLYFVNTLDRANDNTGSNAQAETLCFDSSGRLVAFNCSFLSHQDTLYIGVATKGSKTGTKAWLYKCYIEGDTDYIWGYADVCLIEECSLHTVRDSAVTGTQKSYIFASRTDVNAAKCNKGFVLFKSKILVDTGVEAYYGRDSGADTQATVTDNDFTGVIFSGDDKKQGLWGSATGSYVNDIAGDMAIGYKDGNNRQAGQEIATAKRFSGCGQLSQRVANREYNGRYVILNRGYNTTSKKYETCDAPWSLSTFESDFGATPDKSKDNIFIEPVFVENLCASGDTQNATFVVTDITGTPVTGATLTSSDANALSIQGLVASAVAGKAANDIHITATATGKNSDFALGNVLAQEIKPTSISITDVPQEGNVIQDGVIFLSVAFTPEDTTDKRITWSSSDATSVEVISDEKDENGTQGKVFAIKKTLSPVTLTATSNADNTKTAQCTISVVDTGKAIGPVTSDIVFSFIKPLSQSHDSFLSGATSSNATHSYNVAKSQNGKLITLLKSHKQVVLKDAYFQMKNNGWASNAYTYAPGQDALKIAGVEGSFDIEIQQTTKVGSARKVAVVCGTQTKYIDAETSTDTTLYPIKHKLQFAATGENDVIIAASNDFYFGDVTLKAYTGSETPPPVEPVTTTYNLADNAPSGAQQGTAIPDGSTDDGKVSWTGLKYHSAGYGCSTTASTTLTIKVSKASVISFINSSYANGNISATVDGTKVLDAYPAKMQTDKTAFEFLTGDVTGQKDVVLTFSGTTYIGALTVKDATDADTQKVESVAISGSASVAAGESTTLSATVTGKYCVPTTVTWESSAPSVATVGATTGVVTGVQAGDAIITCKSTFDATKKDTKTITVTATVPTPDASTTYTYDIKTDTTQFANANTTSTDTFFVISGSQTNTGHGIVMKKDNYFTVKVAGNCTITLQNCQYDNAQTISVTKADGSSLGSDISIPAGDKSTDGTTTFSYTGAGDTLKFLWTGASGQNYLHGVVVTPSV